MRWRVIIRPNAEVDLQEAWAWYESRRVGLGDEFLIEIRAAIRILEAHPRTAPILLFGLSTSNHAPVSVQIILPD